MFDPISRLNAALEGRYTIERKLGEGGMATVYLAEDLKHDRKVALKVLRPELAAVVGAERFLAEIKTTAGLQHRHILPLHDSGQADTFLFYVMPYVEGESLRDRLDREHQLPVDEAVAITTDVAEALDYAHQRGIIHRDIKPANILLLAGKPVISDFGIALAVGAAGRGRLTETGLSLGTPHYMSPEQATGDLHVGPASDIYALGCVLYEMLVGEPPYTGGTPQAVLGKVITEAPASVTRQRKTVPAHVESVIIRALEKVPADRFRSAGELARALGDRAFRYGESATAGTSAGPSPWKPVALGASAVAAVLAGVLGWSLVSPAAPPPVQRFTLDIAAEMWAMSLPDGSGIVYRSGVEQGALMLRRWDNLEAVPIPGTDGVIDFDPVGLSPTGDRVAFVTGDRELKIAPLAGGVVRTVVDDTECCVSWERDGFLYYTLASSGSIARVPEAGGSPEVVVERVGGEGRLYYGRLAPGSDVLAFTRGGPQPHDIEAVRLSTGERKVVTPGSVSYFTPRGELVFGSGGQLLAAPFDTEGMELTTAAIPVAEGVFAIDGYHIYSLSGDGTVVYPLGETSDAANFEWVWFSRTGDVSPAASDDRVDLGPVFNGGFRLSPDGTRVAFARVADGNQDIWTKALPDGPLSRLTVSEAMEYGPQWTPDGRNVTFVSNRPVGSDTLVADDRRLWMRRADGTGQAEVVYDGLRVAEGLWTPDGSWLLLRTAGATAEGAQAERDLHAIRPSEDGDPMTLVATPLFWEQGAAVSPDGRWLAYSSNETGRNEIFVRPFPDVEGGKWQVSTEGGIRPLWAHSGRELFFINPESRQLLSAEFTVGDDTFQRGQVAALFELPNGVYTRFEGGSAFYDPSPDDQRFLMLRVEALDDFPSTSVLVQNFGEHLRRLLRPER